MTRENPLYLILGKPESILERERSEGGVRYAEAAAGPGRDRKNGPDPPGHRRAIRGRPQLLIVPEQHSHDMERRLCAAGGNSGSPYAEVLSFTRLASRVFSVTGGLAAPALDAGGRLLLMDVALKAVADQLKVYGRPSRKPQFLTRLAATVDELQVQRYFPGKAVGGGPGDRGRDRGQVVRPGPYLRGL